MWYFNNNILKRLLLIDSVKAASCCIIVTHTLLFFCFPNCCRPFFVRGILGSASISAGESTEGCRLPNKKTGPHCLWQIWRLKYMHIYKAFSLWAPQIAHVLSWKCHKCFLFFSSPSETSVDAKCRFGHNSKKEFE